MPRAVLALENAILGQQLGAYLRSEKRPRLHRGDRAFWLILRRVWSGALAIVQPATADPRCVCA